MLMQEHALPAILGLSFVLGLVHAFDADHIVAVSSLATRKQGWKSGVFYAIKWALGHGGILLLVAFAAFYFRVQLPAYVPHSAEKLVGVILIVAGLSLFWSLHSQRITVRIHRHGDVVHAHLAQPNETLQHDHTPVLVGVVHGLAGSAPALALIPATLYQPALALGYVLIFSIGVLTGMLTFGLLLSQSQRFLLKYSPNLLNGSRAVLGIAAIALGVFWLGTS
jgi:nickel/cobalt transporter (NicO) family protein